MRPIKNTMECPMYFTVGNILRREGVGSGRIVKLIVCSDARACKDRYHNFYVCGGFKRVLDNTACICPFFVASDDDRFLAIFPGGNRVI